MKIAGECCWRTLEELAHSVIHLFCLYMILMKGGVVILPKKGKLWY